MDKTNGLFERMKNVFISLGRRIINLKNKINNKVDYKIINAFVVIGLIIILIVSTFMKGDKGMVYTNFANDMSYESSRVSDIRYDYFKTKDDKYITQMKFRIEEPISGYNYCEIYNKQFDHIDKDKYSCLLPFNENQVGVILLKGKVEKFYILQNLDGERTIYSVDGLEYDNELAKLSNTQISFEDNNKEIEKNEYKYAKENKGILFSKIEELNMTYQNKMSTISGLKEEHSSVSNAEKDNIKILLLDAENELTVFKYDSVAYKPMLDLYNKVFKTNYSIPEPTDEEVKRAQEEE